MKLIFTLFILITLILQINSINKYDFNVCRMQNCASRQQLCIEDQSICLKGFSDTRKCMATCTSEQEKQDYKKCWVKCKNSIANTNTLYQDLSRCYEIICYVGQVYLKVMFVAMILLISLIIV